MVSMRIVFMGTPEFAVPSLVKLTESSHIVVGIVTQPDRPKGRGLKVAFSPLKQEALRQNIPILQPEDLRDPAFIKDLTGFDGESFVVVGFRILPPEVFEIPKLGSVNLHASLLPKYRGAAPIQWAIMNGEKKTGVTTFFIEKKVDTGDLILQKEVLIRSEDTAGDLHDRLAAVGSELLLQTLDLIQQGKVVRVIQDGQVTSAPKIKTAHCIIDWTRPAVSIVNQIRALSPYPGAFTYWKGKRLKLFSASHEVCSSQSSELPGTVLDSTDEGITIQTGSGTVRFMEIQSEGKGRMSVKAFLRGHSLVTGDSFDVSSFSNFERDNT
jgi:methionyl-tRNA formyltransferase